MLNKFSAPEQLSRPDGQPSSPTSPSGSNRHKIPLREPSSPDIQGALRSRFFRAVPHRARFDPRPRRRKPPCLEAGSEDLARHAASGEEWKIQAAALWMALSIWESRADRDGGMAKLAFPSNGDFDLFGIYSIILPRSRLQTVIFLVCLTHIIPKRIVMEEASP